MACHLLRIARLEVNSAPEYQVVSVFADATIAVEVRGLSLLILQ